MKNVLVCVCLYVCTHAFVWLYENLAAQCMCINVHVLRLGVSSSHDVRALRETIITQFYKIFSPSFAPSRPFKITSEVNFLLFDCRKKDCCL